MVADEWQEVSAEVRAVLGAVIEWRLVAARWQQVRDLIAEMRSAVAADDAKSVWAAIFQLERLGPMRVSTRLGDVVKEPVPDDVRERINELITALTREDHDRSPD